MAHSSPLLALHLGAKRRHCTRIKTRARHTSSISQLRHAARICVACIQDVGKPFQRLSRTIQTHPFVGSFGRWRHVKKSIGAKGKAHHTSYLTLMKALGSSNILICNNVFMLLNYVYRTLFQTTRCKDAWQRANQSCWISGRVSTLSWAWIHPNGTQRT
jgi:hypothetical protein